MLNLTRRLIGRANSLIKMSEETVVQLPAKVEMLYNSGKKGTWDAKEDVTFSRDAMENPPTGNSPIAGARVERELERGEAPIQLYSLATPNGQKVGIALEEMGLEYDAHFVNIMKGDQFTSGFTELNPNQKIPAILDYGVADRVDPIRVFETGSILLYLAEKTGQFIPSKDNIQERTDVMNWLFWNCGSQGPFTGQFGHFFKYAPRDEKEAVLYGTKRYGMEVSRFMDLLDKELEGKQYLVGDEYTIADMAIVPWVTSVISEKGYNAGDFLSMEKYKNVNRWKDSILERPATARGMTVCSMAGEKPWLEKK